MQTVRKDKGSALAALREKLGDQVTLGSDFLEAVEKKSSRMPTSLSGLDSLLAGGLPQGQLSEIVTEKRSQGSGLVLAELLAQARRERKYAMLLDVGRTFTPEGIPEEDLESLLWVGCDSAVQAVEALDTASRDENFHLFLIDLRDCEPTDWQAVKRSVWYRVVTQLRERDAVAVVFAKRAVTSVTKCRLMVEAKLSLDSIHRERSALLRRACFEKMEGAISQLEPSRHSEIRRAG